MQNRSRAGGILSIVAGGLGGVLGLAWAFSGNWMSEFMFSQPYLFATMLLFTSISDGVTGIGCALLGGLGIVGGVFALKKKRWSLALAGAIAGAVTFFPVGIAATIFVIKAQPEFSTPELSPPADEPPQSVAR